MKSLIFNTDKNVYKQESHSTSSNSRMLTLKTVLYEPWKLVTGIQKFCEKKYHYKYESTTSSSNKPQSSLNYELCGLYSEENYRDQTKS